MEGELQTDGSVVDHYVKRILDNEFEFDVADPTKGQVGSGIADALRRLSNADKELERVSKEILLRYFVKECWNEIKSMRFFLHDFWMIWESYLRMRLY